MASLASYMLLDAQYIGIQIVIAKHQSNDIIRPYQDIIRKEAFVLICLY